MVVAATTVFSPAWWLVILAYALGRGRRPWNPLDTTLASFFAGFAGAVLYRAYYFEPTTRGNTVFNAMIGLVLLTVPVVFSLQRVRPLLATPTGQSLWVTNYLAIPIWSALGVLFGRWIVAAID